MPLYDPTIDKSVLSAERSVVIDLVQPLIAGRRMRSIDGEARRNEPSRQGAGTR
jgi:hypothetical protein